MWATSAVYSFEQFWTVYLPEPISSTTVEEEAEWLVELLLPKREQFAQQAAFALALSREAGPHPVYE